MANCRAVDRSTCRVHGTGGMYQHLQTVANDALNKRDFETYYDARAKMDEMSDDSKKALKFFERGGVPTVSERVVGKLEGMADSIISVRDNINEAVVNAIEGTEDSDKRQGDPDSEKQKISLGDKMDNAADRVLDVGENIADTVSAGMDIIADRHKREIPAEIGGSTVAWSDLNPFKNPFKNGKLR